MQLNLYYEQLMEYRDIIDDKVSNGKIGINKAEMLTKKINQWYNQAKVINKTRVKKETKKNDSKV